MAVTNRMIKATPAQVYEVLADGWNYADWVVGAVHIRAVDPQWPAAGARVHHRVGAWPLTIADATEVLACDPAGQLVLRAKLWPLGEARVEVTWRGQGQGHTLLTMAETFSNGPLLVLRNRVNDVFLRQRNQESLRRLEDMTRRYPAAARS